MLNDARKITVCEMALGTERGRLPLYAEAASNLGNAGFDPRFVKGGGTQRTVEVERGDEVLRGLQPGPIAFVKVDVEGYEASVLKGLSQTLSEHKPVVMFESQPALAGYDPEEVPRFLRSLGYAHFYSVQQRELAPLRSGPKILRSLVDSVRRALIGNHYYLVPVHELRQGYYATVLACVRPLPG